MEIQNAIRNIAGNIVRDKDFYATEFLDEPITAQLKDSLKNGDLERLSVLFEKTIPEIGLSGKDLQLYCIKLIRTLFEFLSEIGASKDAIQLSKKNVITQMLEIKNGETLISFSYHCFLDMLQFQTEKIPHSSRISQAMQSFILSHYSDPNLSITQLADAFSLSPVYTRSLFRKETGVSFNRFLSQLRMDKAAELLKDPKNKIQDVSLQCGYLDSQYFGKVFKKAFLVTPSEYRSKLIIP